MNQESQNLNVRADFSASPKVIKLNDKGSSKTTSKGNTSTSTGKSISQGESYSEQTG